jgi:hypothetical protein
VRHVLVAAAVVVAFASLVLAGDPPKSPHPHFQDGGALSWSKKLADAQTAAKAADRLIFIEYGREN